MILALTRLGRHMVDDPVELVNVGSQLCPEQPRPVAAVLALRVVALEPERVEQARRRVTVVVFLNTLL